MQHYELFFVGSIKLSEGEQEVLLEKISKQAMSLGITVTLTKEVGKRRLAYPIKKESQGYYFLLEFDGEQSQIKKVLRFLILRKRVKTAEEIVQETRLREKIEGKKREAERAELVNEQERIKEETKKEEVKKPESVKKISLEDLDKKLDDILKEEDV
jgi:small subunit ribosomal protein S6